MPNMDEMDGGGTSTAASNESKDDTVVDAEEQIIIQNGTPTGSATSGPKAIDPVGGLEEEGLMNLYESRLKRLRDYESRVHSRYNSQAAGRGTLATTYPQTLQSISPTTPTPATDNSLVASSSLPREIDVDGGESLGDLTLSTGFNSNTGGAVEILSKNKLDSALLQPPEAGPDTEDEKCSVPEDKEVGELSAEDVSERESNHEQDLDVDTLKEEEEAYSIEDHVSEIKDTEDEESSLQLEEDEGYTYDGALDSKYQTYALLVDPEADDRAVEITLYSNARPHMRAFHAAWIGFFIAFFAWFAITPLLSEVARSLSLGRREIWTSSTLAVASSAITRVIAGPANDIYGPRLTMFTSLIVSAIPCTFAGLAIQNTTSLYIVRFLIGCGGSAFVNCQFWASSMFIPEVAGTALSLVAGWGNLGGGVAQVVVGSLLFPLFKVIYGGEGYGQAKTVYVDDDDIEYEFDKASDRAWRTVMVIPGLMVLAMSFYALKCTDDSPKGNFRKRKEQGLMASQESTWTALRRAAGHINTWLLFIQYGCCFGVELTMTNAAALYFQEEFGLNTETAAAIASIFGWMNLFARGLGGFCSDMASSLYGMRGRLYVQLIFLALEGALVCIFAQTHSLASAIVVMVIFSVFVQAAEGSTFGIVPFIDNTVTGSISGFIGAGGNTGSVAFSLIFREYDNRSAFVMMGSMVLGSCILTPFIAIGGNRGLFTGNDNSAVLERRDTHAERKGTRPNIEIRSINKDVNQARQSTLRVSDETVPGASDTSGAHADKKCDPATALLPDENPTSVSEEV